MDYTEAILTNLTALKDLELQKEDDVSYYKALAYKRVIDQIADLDHSVKKFEDLKGVSGIGQSIAAKIKEILETGSLQSVPQVNEETTRGLEELQSVHGIGQKKAQQLLKQGITTVKQLAREVEKDPGLLNAIQKKGLKYHDFSAERIPRSEMMQHKKILLARLPKDFTAELTGSFRRKTADSGDIDVLVTYPEKKYTFHEASSHFRNNFIFGLEEDGYVVDTLASGEKKWMGYVAKGPRSAVRRLDLLLTRPDQYAYSLLYFTGSGDFNVALRTWANGLGYTLNEHGLFPLKGSGAPKVPRLNTEEEIFDFLGLEYVPPKNRVNGEQLVPKEMK